MRPRALVAPLVVAAVLVAAEAAPGKPYRWVDEHGTVHYSDQPPPSVSPPTGRQSEPAGAAPAPTVPALPPGPPPTSPSRATPPEPPPVASPEPAGPPTGASAPPPEPERPSLSPPPPMPGVSQTAQEIMELSGLDRWIDHVANSVRGEFGRYRFRIANPEAAWAALAQAFRREALAASAAQALMRSLEPDDVTPLLAWLRSPLSRKVTELQAASTTAAGQNEYRTFVSKLPDAPPPTARLTLIQRLERERQVAEFQVQMARAVRGSLARVLAPLKTSPGRGREDADDARPRSEEWARFHAVTMMLFAYRSLTEEELAEYARFSESAVGARSLKIYEESLGEALRAAEQRAAAALKGLSSPTARAAGTAARP